MQNDLCWKNFNQTKTKRNHKMNTRPNCFAKIVSEQTALFVCVCVCLSPIGEQICALTHFLLCVWIGIYLCCREKSAINRDEHQVPRPKSSMLRIFEIAFEYHQSKSIVGFNCCTTNNTLQTRLVGGFFFGLHVNKLMYEDRPKWCH